MNWYLKVLRQWSDFSTRARRKEYWFFVLFNFLAVVACAILDGILGSTFEGQNVGIITLIYELFVLIPAIAVSVRRLHDIGRTGWWILISIIPLVGVIVLFIFHVTDSEPGTNQYGPNPKID